MERHIHLDPESQAAKQARQRALRLVAARIGGGRANPEVYFSEFNAVMSEMQGDVETLAHLLNELTEISWALVLLVGEVTDDEEEPLDLSALREKDSATIMALIGNWLEQRGSQPPSAS